MVPKETLSRKFLWGYRALSSPDFSSCVCCCCCFELLDLSFPVRPECEGSNFSWLRWRVSTSLILKSVGYCFSPWPGHTVFTSTSCHILLNLNLPLSSPLLLHDSERHISALPWGGVKGSRRETADPRAQLLAQRAWLPHGEAAHLLGRLLLTPNQGIGRNGRTCLWVQVSVRGHSTRTSLSSVVNTAVTGALKSQSRNLQALCLPRHTADEPKDCFQGQLAQLHRPFRGLNLNYSLNHPLTCRFGPFCF